MAKQVETQSDFSSVDNKKPQQRSCIPCYTHCLTNWSKSASGGFFFILLVLAGLYGGGLVTGPTASQGQIWTPDNMLKLFDTQQGLVGQDTSRFEIENYNQYCLVLPGDASCAAPISPLGLFFSGPYSRADVQALNQSRIDASLAAALTPEGLRSADFFFDKTLRAAASASPPVYRGEVTRLRLSFAGPFNETVPGPNGPRLKYPNIFVDEEEQMDDFKEWVVQYNDFFAEPDPAGMSIQYYNTEAGNAELNSLITGDFILAGAAGVIVVIIVCLQTGSYVLALVGMFSVVFSFPVALTLYHGLLGIEHNTQLNQLTFYIILGIGADDIFVLVDAWRQSELEPESVVGPPGAAGLAKRFEWVWRRAAASMFVTSATTFVAFVMTALSPIPAIGAFGTLAALMVLVNYLSIISFFSAFVLVWHKHFEHTCCRCFWPLCWPPFMRCCSCCELLYADGCCFCCPGRPSARVAAGLQHQKRDAAGESSKEHDDTSTAAGPRPAESVSHDAAAFGATVPVQQSKSPSSSGGAQAGAITAAAASADKEIDAPQATTGGANAAAAPQSGEQPEHEDRDVDKHRCMERFCYNTWAPLVYKGRWAIIALGFCVLVASIVGTAYLSPPDQQASGLPDESELQKAIDKIDAFPASAASFLVKVEVMYGINPEDPLDRAGIDRNDPDELGTLNLDSPADFAIHTAAVQQHIVESVCVALPGAIVPGQGVPYALFGDQVECWLHDWALWRNATLGTGNMYADFSSPEAFKTNVQAWTETLSTTAARSVAQRAGGLLEEGGRIQWVGITFNSTIPVDGAINVLSDFRDAWGQQMSRINAAAPAGGQRGFAATGQFAWVATSEVLVSSTYESIAVSFAVAVVFLMIFSGNWIVAAFASGTIVCIVLGVLALIAAIPGLELGTVESICATIVVGLAVDYTVHLAHSFQSGANEGRFERSRHSLFEIGVSVVGGASTSLCAAFVLFFAKLLFFQRFGQLIFTTLFLSILLSTTLFIAALMLFGPSKHPEGDLAPLFREAWAKLTGQQQPASSMVAAKELGHGGTGESGPEPTVVQPAASTQAHSDSQESLDEHKHEDSTQSLSGSDGRNDEAGRDHALVPDGSTGHGTALAAGETQGVNASAIAPIAPDASAAAPERSQGTEVELVNVRGASHNSAV